MTDHFTATIGDRLRQVIPDGGIRGFQREMEARKVRGRSYAMVHRYLSGEEKPPLEFLEAAADYLGVTPAWLICGEGSPKKLDVSSDAAYKLLWMVHDKEAVLGAFHAALRRLVQSAETDPEPEQVKRLGDLLVDLVREPYRRLGHGLPGGAPQLQDHYIALLSAITLIMPMWRSVPIEKLIARLEGPTDD